MHGDLVRLFSRAYLDSVQNKKWLKFLLLEQKQSRTEPELKAPPIWHAAPSCQNVRDFSALWGSVFARNMSCNSLLSLNHLQVELALNGNIDSKLYLPIVLPFAFRRQETTLGLREISTEKRHESTPASLSCLRGYYSNMAPGTVV